jgi:hypothetical protein
MTRIGPWLIAPACLALAAGVARAEHPGSGTDAVPGKTAPSAPPGKTTADCCEHQMTGTVSHLDRSAGTVSIDVPGASDIELRLPPEEIAGFREGDEVVVSMGLHESRSADAPARADDDGTLEPGRDVR